MKKLTKSNLNLTWIEQNNCSDNMTILNEYFPPISMSNETYLFMI